MATTTATVSMAVETDKWRKLAAATVPGKQLPEKNKMAAEAESNENEQKKVGAKETMEEMLFLSASLSDWLASLSRPTFIAGHEVCQRVAGARVSCEFCQSFDWQCKHLNAAAVA